MSLCGTVQYLAPEIALGNPYNETVDWWSFGVTIYEMLAGSLPFDHKERHHLMRYIVSKDCKMKRGFSKEAKSLLTGLLQKDPKFRLGARGVEEIMKHEFFRTVDWDLLVSKELNEFCFDPPKDMKIYTSASCSLSE